MTAFVLFLASVALWGFIIFLLATGGHPPAWLVWPLLADTRGVDVVDCVAKGKWAAQRDD